MAESQKVYLDGTRIKEIYDRISEEIDSVNAIQQAYVNEQIHVNKEAYELALASHSIKLIPIHIDLYNFIIESVPDFQCMKIFGMENKDLEFTKADTLLLTEIGINKSALNLFDVIIQSK